MDANNNSVNPLLLSAEETARFIGIGERFLWGMHNTGELGPLPIKLGKRTLWSRFELESWVRARCPRRDVWATMKDEQHATV
jgi:predicted DNA-binding transcriptional regulator AlpA